MNSPPHRRKSRSSRCRDTRPKKSPPRCTFRRVRSQPISAPRIERFESTVAVNLPPNGPAVDEPRREIWMANLVRTITSGPERIALVGPSGSGMSTILRQLGEYTDVVTQDRSEPHFEVDGQLVRGMSECSEPNEWDVVMDIPRWSRGSLDGLARQRELLLSPARVDVAAHVADGRPGVFLEIIGAEPLHWWEPLILTGASEEPLFAELYLLLGLIGDLSLLEVEAAGLDDQLAALRAARRARESFGRVLAIDPHHARVCWQRADPSRRLGLLEQVSGSPECAFMEAAVAMACDTVPRALPADIERASGQAMRSPARANELLQAMGSRSHHVRVPTSPASLAASPHDVWRLAESGDIEIALAAATFHWYAVAQGELTHSLREPMTTLYQLASASFEGLQLFRWLDEATSVISGSSTYLSDMPRTGLHSVDAALRLAGDLVQHQPNTAARKVDVEAPRLELLRPFLVCLDWLAAPLGPPPQQRCWLTPRVELTARQRGAAEETGSQKPEPTTILESARLLLLKCRQRRFDGMAEAATNTIRECSALISMTHCRSWQHQADLERRKLERQIDRQSTLTATECEVAWSLIHGQTTASIAARRGRSAKTISSQRRSILKKLGAEDLEQARWILAGESD